MVRSRVGMLVVGALVIGAAALAVLRPSAVEGLLPDGAGRVLDRIAPGGTAGRSGTEPGDFLRDAAEGVLAEGAIAAGPGNAPVFLRDVITGYTTRIDADAPTGITLIRPVLGCRLTPPSAASVIGHVTAGASGVRTALKTYNDRQLAAAVQAFVDHYRKTGAPDPAPPGAPAYEAYDVAVTETRAPVYLVLETGPGNRLWNIHLAPGARIERVVLLGGDQAGVANLDPVVPVEVLLRDGLDNCGIRPAYPLNPGHDLFRAVADGRLSAAEAEAQLAERLEAVDRYDTWFHDSFGVKAAASRVGYDAGTISVIGPVPGEGQPKAVYASIRGSDIRMTQDSFFEIAGQVPAGEDFASRAAAIARAFAFGDLENLRQGVQF